jgi:transcriptional regulator with XRE-family HTH domain
MVYAQKDASSEEAKLMRKKGGRWLAVLRNAVGLTQKDLANILDLDFYTFISQLENGVGRIPPNLLIRYANAVGVDPRVFALRVVKFYDPHLHEALTYNSPA